MNLMAFNTTFDVVQSFPSTKIKFYTAFIKKKMLTKPCDVQQSI